MKAKTIKFFSPEENSPKIEKAATKSKPTGYISAAGKLVLPAATLEELGIEPEGTQFKIGTQGGKRTLKLLYLIPTTDSAGSFSMVKSGRGYVIPLAVILEKGGINYSANKYSFTVSLFNYEEGVVGYELTLESDVPKPVYTGKPRGRKPKSEVAA